TPAPGARAVPLVRANGTPSLCACDGPTARVGPSAESFRIPLVVVSQQIVTRDDPADWWLATETAVAPMPIVVVQPAIESVGPLRGAVERGTVRLLAQHRADE